VDEAVGRTVGGTVATPTAGVGLALEATPDDSGPTQRTATVAIRTTCENVRKRDISDMIEHRTRAGSRL
jgi:hypothetical protein